MFNGLAEHHHLYDAQPVAAQPEKQGSRQPARRSDLSKAAGNAANPAAAELLEGAALTTRVQAAADVVHADPDTAAQKSDAATTAEVLLPAQVC